MVTVIVDGVQIMTSRSAGVRKTLSTSVPSQMRSLVIGMLKQSIWFWFAKLKAGSIVTTV